MAGTIRTYRDAVAVITGGASGIGAALARKLAASGAKVILADRQEPESAALAREIGQGAEAAGLDVRDGDAFERLIAGTFERHGRLDYLFNNAGTGVRGEVKDHKLEDWRYVVDVNLLGVMHGIHAAYRRMVEQGFGHIVNTSSVAGLMGLPYTTVYSATKHGIVGLSKALRIEAAVYNVRVSALCPGVIRTPLLDGGRYGVNRTATPRDVLEKMMDAYRPMEPAELAERALRRVARNEAIIVEPARWGIPVWMSRFMPGIFERLTTQAYLKERAQHEEFARLAAEQGDHPLAR
jgi:NAD(P)-dependent dehydrogenase (short-subunit alcohol dehydrogenase family)